MAQKHFISWLLASKYCFVFTQLFSLFLKFCSAQPDILFEFVSLYAQYHDNGNILGLSYYRHIFTKSGTSFYKHYKNTFNFMRPKNQNSQKRR